MGLLAAQTEVYELREPIDMDESPQERPTKRVQCPYCHYVQLVPYIYQAKRRFLFPRYCGVCGKRYADMENQLTMFD